MTDAGAASNGHGDWVEEHLRRYLASGGAEGHVVDVSSVGGHAMTTHCLIRCAGRTSGRMRITPLIYGNVAGEIVVVASKGGADDHPQWYLNVRESPSVDVQIATQAFEATWREPVDDERHAVWSYMTHLYPPYLAYQSSTTRHIPIVMLKTGPAIEVFGAHDGS